jgi:hypothetical protein
MPNNILFSYVIPALVSLDLGGILLRWRMFDHFVGGNADVFFFQLYTDISI